MWWGPSWPPSITSLLSFYRISVPWKSLRPSFLRIFLRRQRRLKSSSSKGDARPSCMTTASEGKSISSLPPALPWHGEKHLYHHLQQHHHLHHHPLRDQHHPLEVCVDRNPRSSLSNLVHVCAWRFEIILWWSYTFILCCIQYGANHCHDSSLWVVSLCSWGLRVT
jgi:hypothetical protein